MNINYEAHYILVQKKLNLVIDNYSNKRKFAVWISEVNGAVRSLTVERGLDTKKYKRILSLQRSVLRK